MRVHLPFPTLFKTLLATSLLVCAVITPSSAQRSGLNLIRDDEIETYLREWTDGIVRAAGLTPEQVNIILVQSPEVNAFVAGGANVFIYTGLIEKTDSAGEVVAVIAHEIGHIAGGHLTRTRDAQQIASYEAIAATLLGVGVAVASGDGGAAAVGAAIGQTTGRNSLMAFSRVQESSADQAGMRFMETAQTNPTGMLTFLGKLSNEELLPTSAQSGFSRSHPMSRDRIEALQAKVDNSPLRTKALPASWDSEYARTKAKLLGFTTPQQVTYKYNSSDNGIPSLYARAISAYRMSHKEDALKLTDKLIAREPKNPWFLELKGQMLYEFGQAKASLDPYEKAIAVKPSAGLIRIAYAQSLIDVAGRNPDMLKKAIDQLKRAQIDEPRSSRVKRLLATAYGRMGDEVRARVYLAEESLMQGRKAEAASRAKSALSQLPPGSPEAIRAADVMSSVDGREIND